jgi:hypothetical protein
MGLRQIIYSVLMWGTLIYAMRRGGWPERASAWIMAIVSVLSATVAANYAHVMTTVLIYDLITFFALFAIGLYSERYWPMWIAAMGGVTVLSHLLPLMPLSNPSVARNAVVLWSWPILLIIVRATYQHSLEREGSGSSPS